MFMSVGLVAHCYTWTQTVAALWREASAWV